MIFGKISSVKVFLSILVPERAHNHTKAELLLRCCQKCSIKFNLILSNVWCQIVLVPYCPVPNCPGAILSGCQIVRFYYLGAKLSDLLSWCQIVRCQIVRCQIVRCEIVLQSNLVLFGQKILFFTGEIKSFVTYITEYPPRHLVHIGFWSGIGQNVKKNGNIWPKMTKMHILDQIWPFLGQKPNFYGSK